LPMVFFWELGKLMVYLVLKLPFTSHNISHAIFANGC